MPSRVAPEWHALRVQTLGADDPHHLPERPAEELGDPLLRQQSAHDSRRLAPNSTRSTWYSMDLMLPGWGS